MQESVIVVWCSFWSLAASLQVFLQVFWLTEKLWQIRRNREFRSISGWIPRGSITQGFALVYPAPHTFLGSFRFSQARMTGHF